MKIILIGSPRSASILKTSKYLTSKYLPEFDITFLNYTGEILGWSAYLAGYLSYLTDDYVIFALDDYLISEAVDQEKYKLALNSLEEGVNNVKLCKNTPKEHEEYPVTTQYTIWNREYLIRLLGRTNSPWNFEITGSLLFSGKALNIPCFEYNTASAISVQRWEGIRLTGLKEEDIKYIKENELI